MVFVSFKLIGKISKITKSEKLERADNTQVLFKYVKVMVKCQDPVYKVVLTFQQHSAKHCFGALV